jgi:photosynthetic reaction center cytochrome c subunit
MVALLLFTPALAQEPTPAPAAQPEHKKFEWPKPKKTKVIPRSASPEELRSAMMMMVRGLGVRCITCHVGKEPDDLTTFDFASDAKQNKMNARLMLKMQNDINQKYLPKVNPDPPDNDKAQVTCFTCHQKQLKPPAPPSAPAHS